MRQNWHTPKPSDNLDPIDRQAEREGQAINRAYRSVRFTRMVPIVDRPPTPPAQTQMRTSLNKV